MILMLEEIIDLVIEFQLLFYCKCMYSVLGKFKVVCIMLCDYDFI